MFNEPIHVLGAGSIGLLWTASIRSKFPTYPITLLLRDHHRNNNMDRVVCGSNSDNHDAAQDHRLDISWNNRQYLHPDHQHQAAATATATSSIPITTQQIISLPVQFINDSSNKNHEQKQGEQERIKTLIVATKAHQAKRAVESVLDRLLPKVDSDDDSDSPSSSSSSSSPNHTQIIVLCNGAISVREELSKILQHNPNINNNSKIVLATTTHGAYLPEPHRLVHAGVGTTFLEEQQQQLPSSSSLDGTMVDLWNKAGLNCTSLSSQQMNSMLWNKLAANCVINPLTSIFRCTNGELLMEPSFLELQEDILTEVAHVAAAVAAATTTTSTTTIEPEVVVDQEKETGEETNNKNNDDDDNNNNNIASIIPSIDEMRKFVTQTILDTRDNKSSMYQDIIKGQQTEIEHLNGYVVRKGREMGKDCPANEDLRSRIAELTAVTMQNK